MQRHIVHLRIDAFPVAVERLRDRSLRNRPLVICSRHSPRAPIVCASQEARREGVFEGLPVTKALSRCRSLVIRPPDEILYRKAEEEVGRILSGYSPLVEGRWGRFYMDMSGTGRLFGSSSDAAFRIRSEVEKRLRLVGTMGVGSNKLISGVAAKVVESHGDLYTVPPGSEASFLAPLQVGMLPALQRRKERERLADLNIRRVQDLASLSALQLHAVFGKWGLLIHRQALGIDDRPVLPPSSKSFVLEEKTLEEDTNDDGMLLGVLFLLVQRACSRMRSRGEIPRTVWLHVRHTDGMDVTRRLKLAEPMAPDPILFRVLEPLYRESTERRQRVRYMSLTFTDLALPSAQMALFDPQSVHPREEALVQALDRIRGKFGENSVLWGRVGEIKT